MGKLIKQQNFEVAPEELRTWQGRKEWFFNRDDTDHYEQYYEGPYKYQEVWQKKTLEGLIKQDTRVKSLLEFGCGTTRFTRWWHEIGLEATGGDISPFMLAQGVQLFGGDLVLADSHHMPFKDHSFDALAFVTTFEYYQNPVQVIREAVRVGKYGIIFGMMNRNTPKLIRRRVQQAFGKNNYYTTAHFYTPGSLKDLVAEALPDRKYVIDWNATGLPKWFPKQQWKIPYGDFFGFHVKLTDV
ncbi:class I SAM-dependent methyltransferase [Algoriphagus aestuariicola]|uniref:Class I SAM-dependent methyltransferase n=1 Tax=Algoriphagus aestuariicola TaxID=1852016 RepID=A0ABS3BJM2_9BACT|nr:class I SAM-dependent methyltransferase [Algoriphagus aestuariicola]MBN7799358.1 class I SAM-dependent methyltransferase [Algoriphagus aestuariicola]